MDNLTHSLAGAVLGQMGLKKKTGLAMPTLIIAANIPDIDALAVLLGGHAHLAIRRGITHGPIAMLILPLVLWGIMLWFDRWQERRGKRPERRPPIHKGWLLALAFIGCLSHPAMDWLNVYGVRLLEPFSSQWFYGDTLFIIDVWIWAALIIGVGLSLRGERKGQGNWQRPAWVSFAAVCAYIFANGLITEKAEAEFTERFTEDRGFLPDMVVASPRPITFWRRDILWRGNWKGDRYYGDYHYNLFYWDDHIGYNLTSTPIQKPHIVDFAMATNNEVSAFLFWSRMPLTSLENDQLVIRDQRFSDPLVGDRFTVRVNISKDKQGPAGR
ncbi:MAG: metal-dependent hydrolase [Sphingorhabdus sp.]